MEITQELAQYPTVYVACYIAPSGFLSNRACMTSTVQYTSHTIAECDGF